MVWEIHLRKLLLIAATVFAAGTSVAIGATQGSTTVPGYDPYQEIVPPGATEPRGEEAPTLPSTSADSPVLLRKAKGSGGTLKTGFGDFLYTGDDDGVRQRLMDQTAEMNGDLVRLFVNWRTVAPTSPTNGFNAADPGDGQYTFGPIDEAVVDATARGLEPILLVTNAPDFAEGQNRDPDAAPGTWKPQPSELADFGEALAKRYSGSFNGLPSVKNYLAWNEPNLPTNLTPQWDETGRKPLASGHYRDMLNAFYEAVKGVDRSNRVITGGTAPYGSPRGNGAVQIRPLLFWRDVMCVDGIKDPRAVKCKEKPKFDVLAHHPINTSGGPTTSAISPDDVSTPDLENLVEVLRAAEKGKNIATGGKHQVWATELWWESNPPDKFKTNPSLATQAKWYAQSLYLLWKQGASVVLFYQVRDDQPFGPPGRFPGSAFETGVYFADDTPKPSMRAVQFPFVADRAGKGKVTIWGIAPTSGKLTVSDSGKKVTSLNAKRGKIFTKSVKFGGKGKLSATVGGEKSLGYPVG